jgi:hypothetical protein
VLVTAANVGYMWNGVVMIGTRHPAALAAALERVLPGAARHAGFTAAVTEGKGRAGRRGRCAGPGWLY